MSRSPLAKKRSSVLTASNTSRATGTKKRTRIQSVNEERILDAALEVFSTYGFRGATVDQIALSAGMSKPNLLYYFRRKQDLYLAVLNRTLEMWLAPFGKINTDGDPAQELKSYIALKLEFSRTHPEASRLFAAEMLQGAPLLKKILDTRVKYLVEEKTAVIQSWIAQKKIANIDPTHLVFMIWAATQHYADFETQIDSILPGKDRKKSRFDDALETISAVMLNGLLPR